MNIARTETDVHPKERNPMVVGQRPEERGIHQAEDRCVPANPQSQRDDRNRREAWLL